MTGGNVRGARLSRARVALTSVLVVALSSHGLAQAPPQLPIAAAMAQPATADAGPIVRAGRAQVDRVLAEPALTPSLVAAQSSSGPRSQRAWPRRLIGGLVGGAAGFFLGGYLGARIEGDDCNCDDPGLKGAVIGAPIGAVAGGILGALFLF
jgi:hypothetical protein